MNLVLTVAEIVSPVFALAAIGYLWIRFGFEYRVEFVTRLAMSLAVPCLIFVALMETEIPPGVLARMTAASLAGHVAIGLAMLALTRAAGLDIRTYLAPLSFGNTGNLGLPLALFAYGEEGLGFAVVVFATTCVLSFTIGIRAIAGAGALGRLVREPLLWATLLGGLFLWQGWTTPGPVTETLRLIGQMAIPLMLLTLGVAVARIVPGDVGRAALLSLAKIAVCAGVGWAAARAFGLPPVATGVLILQFATPVAVTSYMLAHKYGADSTAVAGLVVVSTLLSVVTLPLVLAATL